MFFNKLQRILRHISGCYDNRILCRVIFSVEVKCFISSHIVKILFGYVMPVRMAVAKKKFRKFFARNKTYFFLVDNERLFFVPYIYVPFFLRENRIRDYFFNKRKNFGQMFVQRMNTNRSKIVRDLCGKERTVIIDPLRNRFIRM